MLDPKLPLEILAALKILRDNFSQAIFRKCIFVTLVLKLTLETRDLETVPEKVFTYGLAKLGGDPKLKKKEVSRF